MREDWEREREACSRENEEETDLGGEVNSGFTNDFVLRDLSDVQGTICSKRNKSQPAIFKASELSNVTLLQPFRVFSMISQIIKNKYKRMLLYNLKVYMAKEIWAKIKRYPTE